MRIKNAFTLAETLITLGIIGVVATLTLPNLMSDYKSKVYVGQLQKVYNQMYNAVNQLMADEEADNLSQTYLTEPNGRQRFLKQYFKVTKDCGTPTGSSSGCLAPSYKSLDKSTSRTSSFNRYYCVSLNTGAAVCITEIDENANRYVTREYEYAGMLVDINGQSGPNTAGRDLFYMSIYSDGKIAESWIGDSSRRCLANANSNSAYGQGCFSKVIIDGWKMDY